MAKRGHYARALRRDLGVTLNAPTAGFPRFRVKGSSGKSVTSGVVPLDKPDDPVWAQERAWADEAFDNAVAWARAQRADGIDPATAAAHRARTVADVVAERQAELRRRVGFEEGETRTLEKAADIHKCWVLPTLGATLLLEWGADANRALLAGAGVGAARRTSIGAELRALVTQAHRLRWLPTSRDPMRDVVCWKSARVHGQSAEYIAPELRPTTEQAQALMATMGERCRSTQAYLAAGPRAPRTIDRDWVELAVTVGAFSGLRAGERYGLTVESVLHARGAGQLHVIHTVEEGARTRRLKGLKGRLERYTVVPEDSWGQLVERANVLRDRFGEEAGRYALLFPMHDHALERVPLDREEARRRGVRPGTLGWADSDFWDRSSFRRSIFLPSAQAAGWPVVLDYNSLRHHFAGWLYARSGGDIELVSTCMGHRTPQVTWNTYFRSSEGALERAAKGLRI